jgi:hypothetical protein
MATDTKAIIRKGVSLEQIENALESKYGKITIRVTNSPNFFMALFLDGKEARTMWISFDDTKKEHGIDGIWLSIGCFGNSVEIMKYLCETFGGYLDENDCDDEPFYPINLHLFEQATEFTKRDEFVNKVISKLGYTNVKTALELFEEYKTIN